jgi:hypothetical protein
MKMERNERKRNISCSPYKKWKTLNYFLEKIMIIKKNKD